MQTKRIKEIIESTKRIGITITDLTNQICEETGASRKDAYKMIDAAQHKYSTLLHPAPGCLVAKRYYRP